MPDYTTIDGPDGPVDFPSSMSKDQIGQAMRKLYPPKQQAYALPPESFASKVGAYIPEAAIKPLSVAQKYLVDPFNKMAEKTGEVLGQAGEYVGTYGIPGYVPPLGSVGGGVGKAVGEMAGSMAGDPRNWPFLGAGAARPFLQKIISRGFTGLMAKGTYDAATELHENWDKLTPAQRAEYGTKTGISALMTGIIGREAIKGRPSPPPTKTPVVPEVQAEPVVKTSSPQTGLTADEIRTRIKMAEAKPVEPVLKGEDAVEQVRRAAPLEGKPEAPLPNLVPEEQRASKIIAKEEQTKLAERIEGRAAEKKALETPPIEAPAPIEAKPVIPVRKPGASTIPERPAGLFGDAGVDRPLTSREKIFERVKELKVQGLSDADQVFKLTKEFPQHAEDIAKAYGIKTTKGSDVGRETPPAEALKPDVQPVQTAQTAEKLNEHRSLRGDLGERPPTPPVNTPTPPPLQKKTLNVQERLALQRKIVEELKVKYPNVAKARLQEMAAEKIRREQGSLGGDLGGPRGERREAKINSWINTLRDQNADPRNLDNAFKMLKAFGLEHDEIIRRVSGAEGFAETGKSEWDEITTSPAAEARYMADALLKTAELEKYEVGQSDVSGIKSPDVEELERMSTFKDERKFGREDERGSFSLRPLKPKPLRAGANALDELTAKLEASKKAIAPDDSRMRIMERLNKTITEGWDKTQLSLGRIAAQAVAIKDMYMREPEITSYSSAVGRFSGSLNRSAWELRQFANEIKTKVPDKGRREAITNWIQAGGDDAVLADRAARSKGSLRAGYEAARVLTDDEKVIAEFIAKHFDQRLKDAIQMDILKEGLENYVPQIWKPKDQQGVTNFLSSLHRSGLLKPDFNAAKHRIFDSYFEGEQAGRVPVDKDIGFLVSAWNKAFNQAIASRSLIRDLTKGTAKDGRPVVAPSGTGKAIYDVSSPVEGETPSAYLIYPKALPEEVGDYRVVNHPALSKWTWATKDENGVPIFMKGDLRVHPDHAQKLDNIVNRGKWAAAHPVQSAVLKGQGFFKATLLSMSPFHQVQEGTHALFHKVNPFNPPVIDLTNPSLNKLLDHGLVIGNFDPIAAFEEGLNSSGGLVGMTPGIGPFLQKYNNWLFSDYIPRLKTKMAMDAYERNLKHYQGHVNKGEITTDQLAELTANQANAAFGELNYVTMGRSPQTQAIMRMMFLAPDFLEARARFVGQALRPYGREQYTALVLRGALGQYMIARVLNQLFDDDPHWDRPFSVAVKGYEYKLRTLPGDVWHLMKDPNSFLLHRLNPVLLKPFMELATGRDDLGRHRSIEKQVWDYVQGIAPIPTQGLFKTGSGDKLGSALSGAGLSRTKYRTDAEILARQYTLGTNINEMTSHHVYEMVEDITNGTLDSNKIGDLLTAGKMNPSDLQSAIKLAQLPELYRNYRHLPLELKAKVFLKATNQERAMLRNFEKREFDTMRLLPEQREEFMKNYTNQ